MHLLLIGHGYLGQAIGDAFRSRGWRVTACSRGGNPPDPSVLACDIGDPASVQALAANVAHPDFIVHCAASGHGGPAAYRHVFLAGCRNLTEQFPAVPLLFTSSTSVYAQSDGSEVTEESATEPDRETGRILLETEQVVLAGGGIVARLAGLYGPGRSVILSKYLAGRSVIEDGGGRFLNQVHRDDAAAAVLHLARHQSLPRPAVYNVSDSRPLTQLECHLALARMLDRPLPPSGPRDINRKRGWTHKRVSNAKLVATGWQPRFPCLLDAVDSVVPTLGAPGGTT